MRRTLLWIVFGLGLLWEIINVLGTIDYTKSLIDDKGGPIVKGLVGFVSTHPQWIPITVIALALFLLLCIQIGWPPWRTSEQIAIEKSVYRKTVEHFRDTPHLGLSAFYLAGGLDLPPRSLRTVCKQLQKVKIDPFAGLTKRHWHKFAEQAGAVGRTMATPEDAYHALAEYAETQTLKATWDSTDPAGDFPTFEAFWKKEPPASGPPAETQASTFNEPIELPRKFVVVTPPREVGPKVVPPNVGQGIRERASATIHQLESRISEANRILKESANLLDFMAGLDGTDPKLYEAEKQIPKMLPVGGDQLIKECTAIESETGWTAFREIAGHLMILDQFILNFNKVPSARIKNNILTYTVQHIPARLVDAKAQSVRPLS